MKAATLGLLVAIFVPVAIVAGGLRIKRLQHIATVHPLILRTLFGVLGFMNTVLATDIWLKEGASLGFWASAGTACGFILWGVFHRSGTMADD